MRPSKTDELIRNKVVGSNKEHGVAEEFGRPTRARYLSPSAYLTGHPWERTIDTYSTPEQRSQYHVAKRRRFLVLATF